MMTDFPFLAELFLLGISTVFTDPSNSRQILASLYATLCPRDREMSGERCLDSLVQAGRTVLCAESCVSSWKNLNPIISERQKRIPIISTAKYLQLLQPGHGRTGEELRCYQSGAAPSVQLKTHLLLTHSVSAFPSAYNRCYLKYN